MARRVRPFRKGACLYCARRIEPDYKRPDLLAAFLNKQGRIAARRMRWQQPKDKNKPGRYRGGSGLCRRHQTALAREIRRARFMALL